MAKRRIVTGPSSAGKAPGEAELLKVERLLEQLMPAQRHRWASLLNALLVTAERPSANADKASSSLLIALVNLVGTGEALGILHEPLARLGFAAALPKDDTTPITRTDKDGNTTTYSLGDGAIQEIAYMRQHLGLSVLYIYRHFRYRLGAPTPPAALFASIARVAPPTTPP